MKAIGAILLGSALLRSVHIWMILQLFPPMAFLAVNTFGTSVFFVGIDHFLHIPILTCNWFVVKSIGFPSIILPIVSVNTFSFVVAYQIERTPIGFVVENEEICVEFVSVNQFNLYFLVRMGKAAEVAVTTIVDHFGVILAELLFVLFHSEELFDSVMTFLTFVSLGTFFVVLHMRTQVRRVEISFSLAIILVVVENTHFMLM